MKKCKRLYIILFSLFLIFLFFGYFIVYHQVQKNRLITDVSELVQNNFLGEVKFSNYSVSGKYLQIEDSMEEFFSDFYQQYQKVLSYSQDSQTKSLLSVSNYSKDGTDFVSSISFVEEQKSQYNQDMERLLKYTKKSFIKDYIADLDISSYYKNLYNDMMFQNGIYHKLSNCRGVFLRNQEDMNQVYDVSLQVFKFLKKYADDWKIENNEIQFSTQTLVQQYTSLVSSIQ